MTARYKSLPKAYSIAEIADLLNVCEKTVQRWIKADKLHAHVIDRVIRVTEEDARAFLAAHRR